MADPGASVQPGLDQEPFDTADAFVEWCNAAGGILGCKFTLDKWDSKLTEVAARMIQACAVDFTLAANGEAFDWAGVPQRTKCNLPEIATYVVSREASRVPMSIQAIPASDHQSGLERLRPARLHQGLNTRDEHVALLSGRAGGGR